MEKGKKLLRLGYEGLGGCSRSHGQKKTVQSYSRREGMRQEGGRGGAAESGQIGIVEGVVRGRWRHIHKKKTAHLKNKRKKVGSAILRS